MNGLKHDYLADLCVVPTILSEMSPYRRDKFVTKNIRRTNVDALFVLYTWGEMSVWWCLYRTGGRDYREIELSCFDLPPL